MYASFQYVTLNKECVMALTAPKNTTTDFERCPTGLQSAVCVYVVDMGLQLNKGGESKRKIRLVFETQATISEGEYAGKPFMLSTEMTFSMFKSSLLRATIHNWFGKNMDDETADSFDLEKLIGQQATLNVCENQTNGKTYSNIAAINPATKGVMLSHSGVNCPDWITKRAAEGMVRLSAQEMDQRPDDEKNPPIDAYEADATADADSLPF
jgi:hypothetical protein